MSVLSWHFLVMPKIVSHPRFSSELWQSFPNAQLASLALPNNQQFFRIWDTVQCSRCSSNISFHILPWLHGPWEEGIFSLCCSHPCDNLTGFYPAFSWSIPGCGAVCISITLLLPRQGFALARSNHRGGSVPRVLDTESTWLFTASSALFWGVGLQLVQKVQVGFGF